MTHAFLDKHEPGSQHPGAILHAETVGVERDFPPDIPLLLCVAFRKRFVSWMDGRSTTRGRAYRST
ncbi:hypothetical protein GCM10010116_51760 [Microbispora rosea subsp. aerata]|nr:hypothetical protein GCM10010116_51760 [Microbispora rosea subsp. aerata]GIH56919.1 hypothetical protein Mro02_38330 [Microbispora rosea subsp. aerata]GLJ82845.1 hypothetical protein GCM10017588_15710 [Microbispora rosea subsp. aerata]